MEMGGLKVFAQYVNSYAPIEGAEITFDGETKITDAKGQCLFTNLKPGVYDIRIFKENYGCRLWHGYIFIKAGVISNWTPLLYKSAYLKLTADKTKIKKNETVTIVAEASEHLNIRQIGFNINGTQKVIADYDTDSDIAVMTLNGSNQGKLLITADAPVASSFEPNTYSNVLYIQDGQEE